MDIIRKPRRSSEIGVNGRGQWFRNTGMILMCCRRLFQK
jgi:hypothetical protein